MINCSICGQSADKFVWRRMQNTLSVLHICSARRSCKQASTSGKNLSHVAEASALLVDGIHCGNCDEDSQYLLTAQTKLDHYDFDSKGGWKVMELLKHTAIQLTASIDNQAFSQMNIKYPKYNSRKVKTDTGAELAYGALIAA